MQRPLNPTVEATLFSRERLAGYDPHVLDRKTVLVVGAGALGEKTAINLALSGLAELRNVDHDLYELHNSTRSLCYPTPAEQQRLGMEKARIVAWRLTPLMRAARARVRFAVSYIQELGLGAFSDVDVVVSCVDNARARAYLADASRLLALPLIEAGFDGPDLSLSCYPAARGRKAADAPCWRCSHQELAGAFSCRFAAQQAEAQGVIPAIQAAAATLGGLQAEATIMALHDQLPLANRVFDLNIRTGRSRLTKLATDPACPGIHRTMPGPHRRLTTGPGESVSRLLDELNQTLPQSVAIKLREPFVLRALCQECGQMVEAGEPAWKWAAGPLCSECGGHHIRSTTKATELVPEVFVDLDQTSPKEILETPCAAIGLAAQDLLEVADEKGRMVVLRMSGALSDLFESVAAGEPADASVSRRR